MKQKVQFIASILHEPEFLVLDEPFAGLDPVNQDFFTEIIYELQEIGITILFSAHQMNLVEELCDSIVLINNGKQILSGNLKEIKTSYDLYNVHLHFSENNDISFLLQRNDIELKKTETGFLSFSYREKENINKLISEITANLELKEIQVSTPPSS